jgi:rare lipoprotein A
MKKRRKVTNYSEIRMEQPNKCSYSTSAVSALLFLTTLLTACGGSKNAFTQSGQGSYYADKFNGRPTASGAPYRPGQMTAAHNTLPFGTRIKVTNVKNGRSVKVTVNDRGPHVKGRIVDVSRKAARKLDLVDAGVVPVQLKVIKAASSSKR